MYLRDCPYRLAYGSLESPVLGCYLHQQAVIIGGYLRSRKRIPRVQPDPEPSAAPVIGYPARIGRKVFTGVFCRYTALDCVTMHLYRLLRRYANLGRGQLNPPCYIYLGLNQIYSRNHLRYRMLYLYTGVHFNKIIVSIAIHKKLHCARVYISHGLGYFHRVIIQFLPCLLRYCKGGRKFHYLLIPSLYGAVSLIQMHHISVFISKYLYLYVAGIGQVFFHENLTTAESFFCLLRCAHIGLPQLLRRRCHAHAAAASPGGGLQKHGITIFLRPLQGLL